MGPQGWTPTKGVQQPVEDPVEARDAVVAGRGSGRRSGRKGTKTDMRGGSKEARRRSASKQSDSGNLSDHEEETGAGRAPGVHPTQGRGRLQVGGAFRAD